MIVAHILGIPVEETAGQLIPAGAVTVTAIAVVARTGLGRLRSRRRNSKKTVRSREIQKERAAELPGSDRRLDVEVKIINALSNYP